MVPKRHRAAFSECRLSRWSWSGSWRRGYRVHPIRRSRWRWVSAWRWPPRGMSYRSRRLRANVAILPPNDQFEARPGGIDRTHLHVDQSHRQADVADHVLTDVGRNLGGFLRPADPDHP